MANRVMVIQLALPIERERSSKRQLGSVFTIYGGIHYRKHFGTLLLKPYPEVLHQTPCFPLSKSSSLGC